MSGSDRRLHIGYPWRMRAKSTCKRRHAVAGMRQPPLDPVTKSPRHNLCIVGERIGALAA